MRNIDTLSSKASAHVVTKLADGRYQVVSASSGNSYTVRVAEDGSYRCNCKWGDPYQSGRSRKSGCSHSLAVAAVVAGEQGRKVRAHDGLEVAQRQHRPVVELGQGLYATTRKVA